MKYLKLFIILIMLGSCQDEEFQNQETTVEQEDVILSKEESNQLNKMISEVENSTPGIEVVFKKTDGDLFNIKTADLIIGRSHKVGTVSVDAKSKTEVVVTYTLNRCWTLFRSNVFLGELSDVPLYYGYPDYRLFEYKNRERNQYTITIPVNHISEVSCKTLLAHAKVGFRYGRCWYIYTAWGDGNQFETTRCPATYMTLCEPDDDEEPIDTN